MSDELEDEETLLHELYYDPKFGLQGAQPLLTKAKTINPNIKMKLVKAWLKRQEVQQLHARVRRIKNYFPIKANYQDHIWCVDLCDVSAIAHFNSSVNYLMCVIDVWSRYAWVRPMKNKTNAVATAAFASVLAEGRTPHILMSDNGSEFISRTWEKQLEHHQIEPSYAEPGDHRRMGIVERFNRTLRGMLLKYCTAYKTRRYSDKLDDLVFNYNHTIHRSINSTPSNPDAKQVRQIVDKKEKLAKQCLTTFQVNDTVRYMKNKVMFEKGAEPKFTVGLHMIKEKLGEYNYLLDNGKTYLYYELQATPIVQTLLVDSTNDDIGMSKSQRLANRKFGIDVDNLQYDNRPVAAKSQLNANRGDRLTYY